MLIFKRRKEFFKIITVIISSWLIFYIFLPSDEFKEFFNQYIIVINVSDYLLGLEFPKPFSEESTRHTKALLLMVISGVFIINFIFNNSDNETHNIKFFLLFIFISAIVFFKSGLSRYDTPHIKYTSGLYTLLIFFFISYHLINFLNKLKISDKINYFISKKINSITLTVLVCFLLFFQNNYLNFLNIFKPDKYFYLITKIEDKEFLNNNYYEFIKIFKELTKNESCIQQFTDDNAIAYLVNKPTCTKYYVNGHIIKNWTENNFIEELKNTEPNYIVYSSEINWFKSRNNAPNADKYILDNYFLYKNLSPWKIYKKR